MSFSSRLSDDVWHNQPGPHAFESWHFDALSDDGREALIITFHDNYPFSPRYFSEAENGESLSAEDRGRYPAVSLTYSVDGRIILFAINEFQRDDFSASQKSIGCSIGDSSFRVDAAEYGSGYIVRIDLATARGRRILAELEWLSIETDLSAQPVGADAAGISWNMVAPRSDVSGRITLVGRRGKPRQTIHFRGTGYHDHFRSDRSLKESAFSRCWGRAHFIDSTAIFQHASSIRGETSDLFLIREGSIHQRSARVEFQNISRNSYGFKIPRRLSFVSDDNIHIRVKPMKVIQAGFFEVRMMSEVTLTLRDRRPREAVGITAFSDPERMRNPLLRWLSDLRTGRNGGSPLF